MTADAAICPAAFWHYGRGVVRAARTVPGFALGAVTRPGKCRFLGLEEGESLLDRFAVEKTGDSRRDNAGDHAGCQFAEIGDQQVAIFIVFTNHARSPVNRPVVKLTGELVFNHATFFLDHEDFVQSLGKLVRHHRFQRPAHADLVQANTNFGSELVVYAEITECLQRVEVGFSGGNNTCAIGESGQRVWTPSSGSS